MLKSLTATTAVLMLALLTACSLNGFKDIDKRLFVVSMGIDASDEKEEKYKVTLKLAIPTAKPQAGETESIIVTKESGSITEAVRMVKTNVDKELDFGHMKMIVIGERLAKEREIARYLDWFSRRRDIQRIAWVGIGTPTAEKVLQVETKSERIPSNSLFLSFGDEGSESVYTVSTYLFELQRRLMERGKDPILPIIEADGRDNLYKIHQAAVFNKRNWVMTLTPDETKMYNMLTRSKAKSSLKIKEEHKTFVIHVDDFDMKYRLLAIKAGEPQKILVFGRLRGIVEETLADLEPDSLDEYEQTASSNLEERLRNFLNRLQENRVDPIGFGLKYRATHFGKNEEEWDSWQQIYGKVEYQSNIRTELDSIGIIR